jgi:hypothetical protein
MSEEEYARLTQEKWGKFAPDAGKEELHRSSMHLIKRNV